MTEAGNLIKSKFGDKVIFLDKDGNVVYQAKIVENNGSELPKISCLNLDNFQIYETSLKVEDLQGCDKELIEEFKILR